MEIKEIGTDDECKCRAVNFDNPTFVLPVSVGIWYKQKEIINKEWSRKECHIQLFIENSDRIILKM